MGGTTCTDGQSLPHRTELGSAAGEDVSIEIVRALAAAENVDPDALDLTLHDHIAPDALERLYDHARKQNDQSVTVEFSVEEYTVKLSGDGSLCIA